jgi:hypothetical protein
MSYLASETNNGALQKLVTQAILQVEAAWRRLAGCGDASEEKRFQVRIAAIDKELRHGFAQVLRGGG